MVCLKFSREKHNLFSFGQFGFRGTGKKDDSQKDEERQEEATNPKKELLSKWNLINGLCNAVIFSSTGKGMISMTKKVPL